MNADEEKELSDAWDQWFIWLFASWEYPEAYDLTGPLG